MASAFRTHAGVSRSGSAERFGMEEAKKKINVAQVKLLLELERQKHSPLVPWD
jgi:hypothetical protein